MATDKSVVPATLVMLVVLCGTIVGQVSAATKKALDGATAKRGLHYVVQCSYFSDGYFAWAYRPNHPSARSIEDGGKPDWMARGKTQQEAADQLILDLKGDPNIFPEHERAAKQTKDHCAKPVEGGVSE